MAIVFSTQLRRCAALHVSLLASSLLLPCLAQAQTDLTGSSRLLGDHTEITVGAAAVAAPRYAGAERARVQANPVLVVQRGMLFFDAARGAGLQFQSDSGFYASQSVYYDLGRLQRDNDWRPGSRVLAGMGDVPGSVTARTLLMQQITPYVNVNAEAEFALKDAARRNRYRAGVEFTLLHSASDTVTLDLDVHAGDRRFNQAYFGVTDAQSARSGLQRFNAGSGVYAAAVGSSWTHSLGDHWATTVGVTGTRYADNADDSPLVVRRSFVSGTFAVTYSR
ncbi:MipA/OmpV family protein [Xanthomonas pisi]|uniref:MipA/OmpV family protein n=1 Tax=Xanthomonas pisi TaxID=56457 RepID=A0A2S7D624_9XANT|nr:MipA/OmpV family protein [Xanthomonas pisi]KLD69893.1 membrane protein [Xanthomonas pisi DSM 18956]PPU69209.1 MipA/OmpV family protein [Xanthomonas pisi]